MTVSRKLVLLAVLCALAGCKKKGGKSAPKVEPPARVETVAVASHHFEPVVDLGGEIRPASLANMTTQVDGTVMQLSVEEGDRVKAGQLLAVIDDATARAAVQRSMAAVGVARAAQKSALVQLDAAKLELERNERLFTAKAVDQQTIERLRAQVQGLEAQAGTADAQIRQAQADVNVSSTALAQHRIKAPIDGVVVKRYARLHEYIGRDRPILDIIDNSTMELVTKVPEATGHALVAGSTLSFEIPSLPGRTFDGKIVAVVPQLDPASRTLPVRARLDNPAGELIDGMYARARIPAGKPHEAPAIPEAALRGEGSDRFVWVVRDAKADRVTVTPGASADGLVEIVSGLALGDQVVLGGADGLKPGAAVLPGAAPPALPSEAAREPQKAGN